MQKSAQLQDGEHHHKQPKRPVSTPSTVDYSTQGDPNQIAPQGNHEYSQNNSTTAIQNTYNYLIPDGSDRHIHDI